MEFETLINHLTTRHVPFIPKHPPIEVSHDLSNSDPLSLNLVSQRDWWRHAKSSKRSRWINLAVIQSTKSYSLYTSFLSLVSPQYNLLCTYQQKHEHVEGSIPVYWLNSMIPKLQSN